MRRICFVVFALLVVLLAFPATSSAQIAVGVSIRIGPPALPVYPQPFCPGPGYMWTPGYWAYGPDGYYWVPGTWVMAPAVGLLWTPGYWGWRGGFYYWHAGYWGPHVGFYGGINYGFGYGGVGFVGGYWRGGVFAYNTAVMHVNTTVIHNTYVNNTVVNNVTVNHVSYNGGTGGTTTQPTAAERAAENEHHMPATEAQTQQEHMASTNRAMLASVNQGRPAVAATTRPGEFTGHGVVGAKTAGGTYHPFTPPAHNQPAVKSSNPSTKGNGNQTHNNQAQVHHEGSGQGGKGSNPPPRDHKPDKQEKPH